jgi:hypothetical protein
MMAATPVRQPSSTKTLLGFALLGVVIGVSLAIFAMPYLLFAAYTAMVFFPFSMIAALLLAVFGFLFIAYRASRPEQAAVSHTSRGFLDWRHLMVLSAGIVIGCTMGILSGLGAAP